MNEIILEFQLAIERGVTISEMPIEQVAAENLQIIRTATIGNVVIDRMVTDEMETF